MKQPSFRYVPIQLLGLRKSRNPTCQADPPPIKNHYQHHNRQKMGGGQMKKDTNLIKRTFSNEELLRWIRYISGEFNTQAKEAKRRRHTKSIECSSSNHERITFAFTQGGPILVRDHVWRYKHPQAADADYDSLQVESISIGNSRVWKDGTDKYLRPMIFGSQVYPGEEEADWDCPSIKIYGL
jgi:hypothetical protein